MFKRKPKKLTLRQIHELYLLLRHTLPERDEEFLIDEIDSMIDRMSEETFIKAVEIMYPKSKGNPLQLLLLFIRGLKENDFFEYISFIRKIKHG